MQLIKFGNNMFDNNQTQEQSAQRRTFDSHKRLASNRQSYRVGLNNSGAI